MKILIIHPGGIGDVIMFTPAAKLLKNNFPDAKIDIFTGFTPSAGDVFEEGGIINKIFKFNFAKASFFDKIKFILDLRKEKYDLAIVAAGANPLMGSLFAYFTGAKIRLGEYKKSKFNFYNRQAKMDGNKHKINANLDLLKVLGIKTENSQPFPFFEISNNEKKFAQYFVEKNNLKDKILIGFAIGSGLKQQFKLWPKENFIELGRKILTKIPGVSIIVFGSTNEKELCLKIKEELKENVLVAADYSLKQAAALIDKCKIFVASDSGLAHIASTTNADLIVIFGPTIPERTGPVGPKVHIIKERCSYCYHDIFSLKYDMNRKHQCLKKITPDKVFNKIKEILHNGK